MELVYPPKDKGRDEQTPSMDSWFQGRAWRVDGYYRHHHNRREKIRTELPGRQRHWLGKQR